MFENSFLAHFVNNLIFIHEIKGEIKWIFMANVRAGESNYFI